MKKELRKECIDRRNKITDIKSLSKLIADRLLSLDEYKRAKNVLCYSSFGSEVDTTPLMNAILADGKALFLPRCEVKTHTLEAIRVTDLAALKIGAYGIKEPLGEGIGPNELDLIIVPLVAFDQKKARLGYGGGYYDRFLPKTDAKRVAIAFSHQETDKIPREETDVLMDIIITEKEVIKDAF